MTTQILDEQLATVNREIAAINAYLDTYYASHRIPSGRYVVDYERQLSRLYGRRNELRLSAAAEEARRGSDEDQLRYQALGASGRMHPSKQGV